MVIYCYIVSVVCAEFGPVSGWWAPWALAFHVWPYQGGYFQGDQWGLCQENQGFNLEHVGFTWIYQGKLGDLPGMPTILERPVISLSPLPICRPMSHGETSEVEFLPEGFFLVKILRKIFVGQH